MKRLKKQYVVLVNPRNRKTGVAEKIKAHRDGSLHRAFSIFIFNSRGELLIQQRKKTKYHSGGLWSNTVCSHPRPGETYARAVHRRLREEMGFDCPMRRAFCFIYRAPFQNGLIENEYDCVYVGRFDGIPHDNPAEIMNWKWVTIPALRRDIRKRPWKYSVWLKIALPRVKQSRRILSY
ncbi:MAG: isopentenyl-diphosphate Delta-isomerase [Patescibacteria group bacterium]|nr:isopentenyl-diphosphate Delta-isomerase [Patescibacteria group bacterium]MDD5716050.1 isopentenyl-diphosphate Delta-isomerase [Patescibacteria group bacterium]